MPSGGSLRPSTDDESLIERIPPNLAVGRIAKSEQGLMRRVGEGLRDSRYQPTRDVRITEHSRAGDKLAFTISREGQTCPNVLLLELGEVAEDLLFAHAGREVVEDVIHSDAQPSNDGLASALARLVSNAVLIVHDVTRF
jgi:hypothetical protein